MPVFGRFGELTGRTFAAHHNNDDANSLTRESEISREDLTSFPSDDLCATPAHP